MVSKMTLTFFLLFSMWFLNDLYIKQCYRIVWSEKKKLRAPVIQKIVIKKIMLFWKFTVCDSRKWRFFKNQEASRAFSALEIKTSSRTYQQ